MPKLDAAIYISKITLTAQILLLKIHSLHLLFPLFFLPKGKAHPHGPAHDTCKADVLFFRRGTARGVYEFDIPFSRQQLADYLGVERSGLSVELGKMRDEGLLDFHKSHFLLKTPEADRPFPSARKEPPLGVLARADNPVSHGASGFCRWKKQLRSVEIGRTASARTI